MDKHDLNNLSIYINKEAKIPPPCGAEFGAFFGFIAIYIVRHDGSKYLALVRIFLLLLLHFSWYAKI